MKSHVQWDSAGYWAFTIQIILKHTLTAAKMLGIRYVTLSIMTKIDWISFSDSPTMIMKG